jgi:hypothetical protein
MQGDLAHICKIKNVYAYIIFVGKLRRKTPLANERYSWYGTAQNYLTVTMCDVDSSQLVDLVLQGTCDEPSGSIRTRASSISTL